jgi:hypothetical protein
LSNFTYQRLAAFTPGKDESFIPDDRPASESASGKPLEKLLFPQIFPFQLVLEFANPFPIEVD